MGCAVLHRARTVSSSYTPYIPVGTAAGSRPEQRDNFARGVDVSHRAICSLSSSKAFKWSRLPSNIPTAAVVGTESRAA
ncbi:hypothetical protein J6590_101569 [Homalodisca vitripennis]|nr:hypothetical protein J6590_101569 [Homalodisca vitripennis]